MVTLVANDYGVIGFVLAILIIGGILYAAKRSVGRLVLALGVGGVLTLISYFILIFTGVYDNVKGELKYTPALNVVAIVFILVGLWAGRYAIKRARVTAAK